MRHRHNFEVWNELAEQAVAQIRKGTRVQLVGRLRTSDYKDREGQSRTSVFITTDRIYRIAAEPYRGGEVQSGWKHHSTLLCLWWCKATADSALTIHLTHHAG